MVYDLDGTFDHYTKVTKKCFRDVPTIIIKGKLLIFFMAPKSIKRILVWGLLNTSDVNRDSLKLGLKNKRWYKDEISRGCFVILVY